MPASSAHLRIQPSGGWRRLSRSALRQCVRPGITDDSPALLCSALPSPSRSGLQERYVSSVGQTPPDCIIARTDGFKDLVSASGRKPSDSNHLLKPHPLAARNQRGFVAGVQPGSRLNRAGKLIGLIGPPLRPARAVRQHRANHQFDLPEAEDHLRRSRRSEFACERLVLPQSALALRASEDLALGLGFTTAVEPQPPGALADGLE